MAQNSFLLLKLPDGSAYLLPLTSETDRSLNGPEC